MPIKINRDLYQITPNTILEKARMQDIIDDMLRYVYIDLNEVIDIQHLQRLMLVRIEHSDGSISFFNESTKTIIKFPPGYCIKTEEEWRTNFARKLNLALMYRQTNEEDLAARTGISKITISHYFQRSQTPSAYNLFKLANDFGLPVSFFMKFRFRVKI